ncbi:MAG: ketopantoate reductase family protein [Candidatus Binatia bacterium]
MRVVVLGAGGLGSLVGGYLAKIGVDVTLVGRPAHVQAIRENGLEISGIRGEHLVRENLAAVVSADEARGKFDYLILAVKGKDTEAALASAGALKSRVAVVLSLQNSVEKDEALVRFAGAEKVIGSSTIEGATLVGPGRVVNSLTTPTTAYFGEIDGRLTPRIQALASAFTRAGLVSKTVENIVQVEWEKLAQIAMASGFSVSTLVALPEATFGDGLTVREGAEHYVELGRELVAVYRALGYEPQNFYAPVSKLREVGTLAFEDAVAHVLELGKRFTAEGRRARTSMHEDVLRRRKTEVDFILRPFVEKARELGLAVPTIAGVYRVAKTIDALIPTRS